MYLSKSKMTPKYNKSGKKKNFAINFTHDLVMQALVWLCMVRFRAIRFGTVWFGTLHMNLRRPHMFKCQI
jgi:hypothetical protein